MYRLVVQKLTGELVVLVNNTAELRIKSVPHPPVDLLQYMTEGVNVVLLIGTCSDDGEFLIQGEITGGDGSPPFDRQIYFAPGASAEGSVVYLEHFDLENLNCAAMNPNPYMYLWTPFGTLYYSPKVVADSILSWVGASLASWVNMSDTGAPPGQPGAPPGGGQHGGA